VHHFPDTEISYNGCSAKVYGDDLIGEIFTNLIGNSVRYGGPGVQVEIAVSPVRIGEVSVSIADTGPGIPDELKRVIFQRFSQIESHGTGKGLGLYIVNSLLDRYGGTIRVEDRVPGSYERGARFTFSLKTEG
ncbi:MAG: ATP-binding protein, partial [Methanolinea sp.]|nr:ATP-binding protein [Methanolinea sp.]